MIGFFRGVRLGVKIGGGFGVLLFLTIALGGGAILTMHKVEEKTERLEKEFVPEVGMANDLERNVLKMMYAVRGYGFTEQAAFLEEGRKFLAQSRKSVQEGKNLAEQYTDLVALRGGVDTAEAKLNEYERQIAETASRIGALAANRETLGEAAEKFNENARILAEDQNTAIRREIDTEVPAAKIIERFDKIALINEIISAGGEVRVLALKAMTKRDRELLQQTAKHFETVETNIAQLKPLIHVERNIQRLALVAESAAKYRATLNELAGNWAALDTLNAARRSTGMATLDVSEATARTGMEQMVRMASESEESLTLAARGMIMGLGVAVLIGLALSFFITRSITRPIRRMSTGLQEGADQVASASGQVASSSQQLAEGASEQAAAIEETSSSLEEMASMTRQNSENAAQADRLMKDAFAIAAQAGQSMNELTRSMEDISRASQETQKIIKTIDEIAFQTNLLALNAAVEAARAGEAGAGFAVVADEVRNLALRAAEAAKTTAGLIEGTVKTVKDGSDLVNKTHQEFTELTGSVTKVGELVGEISEASREQSMGIEQINRAVTEMDKVTQQNAANAEESASASEEMNSQAEQMQEFMRELVTLVEGSSHAARNGHSSDPRAESHYDTVAERFTVQVKTTPNTHRHMPAVAPGNGNGNGHGRESKGRLPLLSARGRASSPQAVLPFDEEGVEDF